MNRFQVSGFGFQVRAPKNRFGLEKKLRGFLNRETGNLKRETGFTLLEIVVAMAIVGIGVVTVLQIFSVGLRLATASSARTDAVAYSRQAVDSFLARQIFNARGDSGSIARTFSWHIDVDPVRDDSQDALQNWQVSEITLRLSYPEAERYKEIQMKTIRLMKQKSR